MDWCDVCVGREQLRCYGVRSAKKENENGVARKVRFGYGGFEIVWEFMCWMLFLRNVAEILIVWMLFLSDLVMVDSMLFNNLI